MTNTTVFFENDKMEWEVVDDKIQRQIVGFDDKIMMVNVHFDKDGIGVMHNHPHTQVTYIAEGKFEVTIGDETKIIKKGDSFFVPSNVMHGVVCVEEGMLIDVFSPMREDFLK
ncbi:cupin domain-containing protein [Flavobacterium sp. HNIBRBA15423]|uniref:cupin domain-containing protein n=1 Tax=Flavobacterium sp. HNIBRBA15423 TaxID=3458683 RepID=UPI0040449428